MYEPADFPRMNTFRNKYGFPNVGSTQIKGNSSIVKAWRSFSG